MAERATGRIGERWCRDFDILSTEFAAVLEAQGGVCRICGRSLVIGGGVSAGPCLDHDHATGAIRGILCIRCNAALGQMEDDADRLEAAARYIRHTRALNSTPFFA